MRRTIALIFSSAVWATTAVAGPAVVVSTAPDASVLRGTNSHQCTVGTEVVPGDGISTTNAPVDVVLFASKGKQTGRAVRLDLVRIEERSVLRFDQLTRLETGIEDVVTVNLTVVDGSALFSTRRRSASSELSVGFVGGGVVGVSLGSEAGVCSNGDTTVLTGSATIAFHHPIYGDVQRQIPAGWRYIAAADAMAKLNEAKTTELKTQFDALRRHGIESGYTALLGIQTQHFEPFVSPVHGAKQ